MITERKPGIKVAVYGSLKRGHGNNRLLAAAEYLGRCMVRGKLTMVDLGYYPGVVIREKGDEGAVLCEVYRVDEDTLASLDLLEGNGSYYTRSKVDTQWKKAWCYFLPAEEYLTRDIDVVESGIWKATEEEEQYARAHTPS